MVRRNVAPLAPVGYGAAMHAEAPSATPQGPARSGATSPAAPAAAGATVEFQHVTKQYDPRQKGPGAVNDLSLSVPAGKICVLVGPSGCGKTTSLKMVNRLIEPTSGRILIDGRDISKEDPIQLRRRIGYVIQQTGLFPHLTVGANVAVVPRLLGWDAARQRERTDELLTLIGLEPDVYRDRYPSQLSGGERQRVGVARALAADPPLMLMDEPFGAVDPIVRERLQNEFLRLQEGLAKTIMFVTHDIDEAIKLGNLVAVMQVGGRLAQFGPPAEILANPASEFVARFVGADRGLKRLSLIHVGDLPLRRAMTVRAGEDAAEVRRRITDTGDRFVLLVDAENRPIGWVDRNKLPSSGPLSADPAVSMSPLLDHETTAKDALSMLIAAGVQAGIVVDREGRVEGLTSIADISDQLTTGQAPSSSATPDPARTAG
jgi:osmoprotectant transport system ATP-binding protein